MKFDFCIVTPGWRQLAIALKNIIYKNIKADNMLSGRSSDFDLSVDIFTCNRYDNLFTQFFRLRLIESCRSSTNSSHWIYELLLQRKLSLIKVYTQVTWRAFRNTAPTQLKLFEPFKQIWNLWDFSCTTTAFCAVFVRVFYLIF